MSQRNQTCAVGLAPKRQPWGEPTWEARRVLKAFVAVRHLLWSPLVLLALSQLPLQPSLAVASILVNIKFDCKKQTPEGTVA